MREELELFEGVLAGQEQPGPVTTLHARRMLHPDGTLGEGWVEVGGDRIVGAARGRPSGAGPVTEVDVLSPGFVDTHTHGGAGFGYEDPDLAHVRAAVAAHRRHGTTTTVATLVTDSVPLLRERVQRLAELVQRGELAGVHLEGPCLNPAFKGAHSERLLTTPWEVDLPALCDPSVVHIVTLAPELPGGLEATRDLVGLGVRVAIGHTAADARTTRAAIDEGARIVTHLFNAMPGLQHRATGPVPVALNDPGVVVELVADGQHVAPEVLLLAARSARGGYSLVTDAMAGSCAPDGEYPLGELTATVRDGVARLETDGSIAGSTLTMDEAVRVMVRAGAGLAEVLVAATRTPASALGLADVGRLEAGLLADLVVLDDELVVRGVMRRGRWLER